MSNGAPTLGDAVIAQALGPFEEIEFLGAGSFGETYRVRKSAGNDYAIKAIHNASLPAHLWERELESLRRITSPHVVAFLGAGSFRHATLEVPYLECEYIAGGSIKSRIDASDLSPTPVATRSLLTGLLRATQAAHTQEILHRDIKPANAALRDGDLGEAGPLGLRTCKGIRYVLAHNLSRASWDGNVHGARAVAPTARAPA
jgi:serine/threonine protein kinase